LPKVPPVCFIYVVSLLVYQCILQEDLLPHAPLLLLFTTSAQTHIFPEIRIDAIRFLNILLECIPSAVTSGWAEGSDTHGSRVLSGYIGILNGGTKYGGEHDGMVYPSSESIIWHLNYEYIGPLVATSTASVVLTPAVRFFFYLHMHAISNLCFISLSL
jgi:pre-rRNA-processing protein IPI1